MLMREVSKLFNWKLNFGGIALMWRGGCIIRRYGIPMDTVAGSHGNLREQPDQEVVC